MNHQPYKRWIVLDSKLDDKQRQALHDHLRSCPSCRALSAAHGEVFHLLSTAPASLPHPGFTQRWKSRLAERERMRKTKIAIGATSAILIFSLFALFSLGVEAATLADRLAQVLFQLIREAASWILFATQMKEVLTPLIRVGIKMIPPVWYPLAVLAIPILFGSWIFALSESMVLVRRHSNENV